MWVYSKIHCQYWKFMVHVNYEFSVVAVNFGTQSLYSIKIISHNQRKIITTKTKIQQFLKKPTCLCTNAQSQFFRNQRLNIYCIYFNFIVNCVNKNSYVKEKNFICVLFFCYISFHYISSKFNWIEPISEELRHL